VLDKNTTDRSGKDKVRNPDTNAAEESDRLEVPEKAANKAKAKESSEGKEPGQGERATIRRGIDTERTNCVNGIGTRTTKRNKITQARFTALLHHLTVDQPPGEAVTTNLSGKAGRSETAAGHRGAGRQDCARRVNGIGKRAMSFLEQIIETRCWKRAILERENGIIGVADRCRPPEPTRLQKAQVADHPSVVRGEVRALMPGKVLRVDVSVGDVVTERQPVVTMESMKMESALAAPRAGTVAAVKCQVGQIVEMGEVLVIIE
jgi:biotin carboxyl carrier protein